jgi:hypothetical protein
MPKIGPVLTWDELADLYDKAHPGSGRPARTLSLDTVYKWAEGQPDKFHKDDETGLHQIINISEPITKYAIRVELLKVLVDPKDGTSWHDYSEMDGDTIMVFDREGEAIDFYHGILVKLNE